MVIDPESLAGRIIGLLTKEAESPKTASQIGHALGLVPKEGFILRRTLKGLAQSGKLVRLKGGRFAPPSNLHLSVGTFELAKGKGGVVLPDSIKDPIVVVAPNARQGALDGDRVVVRVEGRLEAGRCFGSIVRILERRLKEAVGTYHERGRVAYVEAVGLKEGFEVIIEEPPPMHVPLQAMVRVRITGYPKADFWATGVVTEVLGDKDSLEPYIEAILVNSAIPIDFQAGALEEAKAIPKAIPGSELQTRRDLRSLSFVTIDGETAKDFDDAVCLVQGKDESSTLYVAIADVAHYVSQGGAIDTEAQDRGTSVYYPSKVVPMLPFELSWGLCSLNPNEDRLVMVAELCYGPKGGLKKADFYPAVIKSRARLTYTQVNELLQGDASSLQGDPALAAMLLAMERLAKILHGARVRKGSLDFDLPETLVMLSQEGAIEGILRGERGWGERLIEEFMIAANVAVARFLFKTKTPCLFRIHEPPDPVKLRGFLTFVKRRGVHFEIDPKKKVTPKDLARFLDVIQGRSDARVLHYMLLRSLMRAQYHPSPKGHFGLALGAYAHFTSPIRRYPDLFVHRMLKARLSDDEAKVRDQTPERVLELAQKTSKAEQRATEVERAMVDLYRVYYGKDRVGETFTGYISSVLPFGFFVELDEAFLEGLVHISQIGDDYYLFDEQRARLIGQHRGRIFGLGDRVNVKIARADLKERKIDFVLAEEPETLARSKRRKRPGIRGQKRGKTA